MVVFIMSELTMKAASPDTLGASRAACPVIQPFQNNTFSTLNHYPTTHNPYTSMVSSGISDFTSPRSTPLRTEQETM
ncbi:hypothetical protein BDV25DRAFT_151724, partial [Aspergillus avenaceus]